MGGISEEQWSLILSELVDFLRGHPEVDDAQQMSAEVESIQAQHGGLPASGVAPLARTIRDTLRKDNSVMGLAFQEYEAITAPVFEKWKDEEQEPPSVDVVRWRPPEHSRVMTDNLEVVWQELEGEAPPRAKLFVAMAGIEVVYELFHAALKQAFVGMTRGVTEDQEIGRRKDRFLRLEWLPTCPVDLYQLRNAWAHATVAVQSDRVVVYIEAEETPVGDLSLEDLRTYIKAALAGLDAVRLDYVIAQAVMAEGDEG